MLLSAAMLGAGSVARGEPTVNGSPNGLEYVLFPAPLTQLAGPALVVNPGESLQLAGWELYPQAFTGLVLDTSRSGGRSASSDLGLRLRPAVYAQRDWGIQKTTVYGVLDAELFRGGTGNTLGGDVGFSHVWEVRRDLAIRADAEAFRSSDPFTRLSDGKLSAYNTARASLQGTAGLGRAFVSLGGLAVRTDYDDRPEGGAQRSQSEVISGRLGYWNTPALYSFIEGSANTRRFDVSAFDSHGFRLLGGMGTDRISLFKGEIYAGLEQANYSAGGSSRGPVFGGRLFWYPLEPLTVSAQFDRSFGDPTIISFVPGTMAAASTQTSGVLLATYTWSPRWNFSARAGDSYVLYAFNARRDQQAFAGATLTYNLTRSLGLTLDYQFTDLKSNVPGQSFARHAISLGATEKY